MLPCCNHVGSLFSHFVFAVEYSNLASTAMICNITLDFGDDTHPPGKFRPELQLQGGLSLRSNDFRVYGTCHVNDGCSGCATQRVRPAFFFNEIRQARHMRHGHRRLSMRQFLVATGLLQSVLSTGAKLVRERVGLWLNSVVFLNSNAGRCISPNLCLCSNPNDLSDSCKSHRRHARLLT